MVRGLDATVGATMLEGESPVLTTYPTPPGLPHTLSKIRVNARLGSISPARHEQPEADTGSHRPIGILGSGVRRIKGGVQDGSDGLRPDPWNV